jgi:hypothetical protein
MTSKAMELAQLGDVVTVSNNGEVGIGTGSDSLTRELTIKKNDQCDVAIVAATNQSAQLLFGDLDADNRGIVQYDNGSDFMAFTVAGSERARIDSSGNLMVGKSALGYTTNGHEIKATGELIVSRSGTPVAINRNSSDGQMINFYKDGSAVGSIGTDGGSLYIGGGDVGFGFYQVSDALVPINGSTGSLRDNAIDLGLASSGRFDDIYATNGSIQTSDRNEKQDIASLTDAEIIAAKAISKLFKTFKWKDKVASKGDAARTHTGVIAQEVEAAMSNAGLDAGNYAFFISTTWWETSTEVAAVEADEENGIKAQEAYTRIDTYNTSDEAPEGATERNRKGIRYPELLSFIGAATEQRLTSIEARLNALEAE